MVLWLISPACLLYQEGFCTHEWVGARVLYQQMWSEKGHQKRGFRDRAKYRYYVQYESEEADSTSVKIQQRVRCATYSWTLSTHHWHGWLHSRYIDQSASWAISRHIDSFVVWRRRSFPSKLLKRWGGEREMESWTRFRERKAEGGRERERRRWYPSDHSCPISSLFSTGWLGECYMLHFFAWRALAWVGIVI